jgi:tellurite resistance protein
MRSYPCLIIGMPLEGRAGYVKQNVREGDEITLERQPDTSGEPDAVACFHGEHCIGHIPHGRQWVSRSLAQDDGHQVRVTGFDTTEAGDLAAVEIEITILNEERPDPDPLAKSIISEIGDELRLLAMVAAADGRVAPPERALLERFADARAREMGIEPEEGEAAHAARWARRKAADSLDAAQIIGRLATDRPSALPIMLAECENMAEIDGSIGQQERQIVTMLRNLLQQGQMTAKETRA